MDINRYIGSFLLKNKYCSLPGLGVFDLKKEGARINSNSETISSPTYQISFTPIGSIDDTFASYIASAENVSISNASNNIREYCKAVKDELAKTGKYEIEFLGKLSMSNNKIVFQQSDELNLGVEPAPLSPLIEKTKVSEATSTIKPDYSYPPARREQQVPVLKFLIPILVIGLLGIGAYFGYTYYKKNQELVPIEESSNMNEMNQVDTVASVIDTTHSAMADSMRGSTDSIAINDSARVAVIDTVKTNNPIASGTLYNVAVLSYDNEASAIAKANKLKNYGNNATVVNNAGRFIVVINASHPLNDTTKLVDSLRRFFNPKGPVYILK